MKFKIGDLVYHGSDASFWQGIIGLVVGVQLDDKPDYEYKCYVIQWFGSDLDTHHFPIKTIHEECMLVLACMPGEEEKAGECEDDNGV